MADILETTLPLPLFYRGKVRDTYTVDDKLLLITTDRISAFDVVLPNGIPDKGKVLTQISEFWFNKTTHIVPNHMVDLLDSVKLVKHYFPALSSDSYNQLIGRSMIVKKAERVDVEAVVRGYISGSAWEEYRKSGTISGMKQPEGLKESQELPECLFTPTTKAESGHDMPMSRNEVEDLLGKSTAQAVEEKSLLLYQFAREYALSKGFIIADTKFEFGFIDGELCLIDEIFTPDSSRFWDIEKYVVGQPQPSFDKQPIRDWLSASGWNKEPPAPKLPEHIVEMSSGRYKEVYARLTGKELRG
jgi:phosphoribosylaminoimidazole-succinocarboxamide synthase